MFWWWIQFTGSSIAVRHHIVVQWQNRAHEAAHASSLHPSKCALLFPAGPHLLGFPLSSSVLAAECQAVNTCPFVGRGGFQVKIVTKFPALKTP